MNGFQNAADALVASGPQRAVPARRRIRFASPVEIKSGRPQRIAALDGLRLLAALMVVAYHYIAISRSWSADGSNSFPKLFPFAAYGWLGVQLFFLISGFVICMSCWGRPLGDFFVSRVIRVFPAYWLAIIATTLVVALVPGGLQPRKWHDVLTNFTMLQEPLHVPHVDGVYWTLFAELRFYLLLAAMAWWGLTYRRLLTLCCVWIAASALGARSESVILRLLIMPDYSWFFIAGIAFYLMYRFRPNILLAGIVLVCFCAAQPSVNRIWRSSLSNMDRTVPYWPTLLVLAACFALMALIATGKLSWCSWRWLPVAGALTYPLYLLHEYIGWEIIRYFSTRVPHHALLIGLVTAMLLAAHLVHRCVERPLSRWLKPRIKTALRQVDPSRRQGLPAE
ncbi:acyltransferase family protein [Streptomyces rimosus]|uniref:acyltransferase family protein n=1 Tax=Streptomyces rimosus TaxID=1927 RepID=UPI0004BFAFEE|nr:acyltransferase [Streptomyces rimosus]